MQENQPLVQLAKLSDILISDSRQRKLHDPKKHQELVESIWRGPVGLQHPIVLREIPEGLQLVSGERRLRAIQDIYVLGGTLRFGGKPLPTEMVPYNLVCDLSPIDAEAAELEENLQRLNLSWQEEAQAVAALAELRRKQAEAQGSPPPTISSLTEELGLSAKVTTSLNSTRAKINIAKYLDDPDVAAAKSLPEAVNIAKRKIEDSRRQEIGQKIEETLSASNHRFIKGDCLEWLAANAAEQFDTILTDPPYGINVDDASYLRNKTTARPHEYDDSLELVDELLQKTFPLLLAAAKPNAHLFLFCDIERFFTLRGFAEEAGWIVFRTPLIWHNPAGWRIPWQEKGPQRKYEAILFAAKGHRPFLRPAGDILSFAREANSDHSAAKPTALYKELLSWSTSPGSSVLDPFAGSGTIFPAAHESKCYATGIEISDLYAGSCVARLEAL